jgi:hypothetical protein
MMAAVVVVLLELFPELLFVLVGGGGGSLPVGPEVPSANTGAARKVSVSNNVMNRRNFFMGESFPGGAGTCVFPATANGCATTPKGEPAHINKFPPKTAGIN